jgi:hypothetical protein
LAGFKNNKGNIMRKLVSILLSLFTVVGGHFFNRRIDLGLLYFALLLIVAMGSSFIFPFLWAIEYQGQHWDGSLAINVIFVMSVCMVLLLLSSLIVSYMKAAEASGRSPLGRTGLVAAFLTTILGALSVATIISIGTQYFKLADSDAFAVAHEEEGGPIPDDSITIRTRFFHELVRYGSEWIPENLLEPMPRGDAYITGRIRFEGRAVEGATLVMVLNSRFISSKLTTDDQGLFKLAVPEGEWTLNRIEINGWPDRPRGGTFTVTGGPNSSLTESMYHSGPQSRSKGLLLRATKAPEVMQGLDLSINRNVELGWPQREGQAVDMESDRIFWKELPGASRYQVQLHKTERDGTSISFRPVAWINTQETQVPLADFKFMADQTDTENEYSVEIYAFDGNGELLAGSSKFIDGRSLILRGQRVVGTDDFLQLDNISGLSSEELQAKVEAEYQDKKRLQAAELLATEGLTDPARILVERVQSQSLEKKKLRASGMILTAEGKCDEARAKFEAANKKPGTACFPQFFSKNCGEQ